MATKQNFELDTSDFLGIRYQSYLDEIEAMSISEPTKYNGIRKGVIKTLKEKLLEATYDTYYKLLTTGEGFNFDGLQPSYPKQKASDFALGATETLNGILDDVLEIVLPANQAGFAKLQTKKKASVAGIV